MTDLFLVLAMPVMALMAFATPLACIARPVPAGVTPRPTLFTGGFHA